MNPDIEIIRSKRRTISVEIGADCRVIVRAPYRMSKAKIDEFIFLNRGWIDKHIKKRQKYIESIPETEKLTESEIRELKKSARSWILKRVGEYAEKIGVNYGKISIRCQKSRWGSCTSKGNLNFNALIMLLPEELRDYVIIHELCHLIELNHSPRFWAEVEKYCPDHKILRKRIRDEGESLLMRL